MTKQFEREINRIADMAKRGLITLREANERMVDEIEIARDNWIESGCPGTWDSYKAYHKVFLLLAKLTREA